MTSTGYLLKWTLLASLLGILTGSSCALFLWLLDHCSRLQAENSWLLWLLPVAGVLIGYVYSTIGKSTEAGTNLILNEIHERGEGVPLRMVPLVLLSTLVTHLFGGSAGREGTAVQMGGSLAAALSRLIPRMSIEDTKILLTAGIASGFSGVFGTPVAGMIFAMEVLTVGRLNSTSIMHDRSDRRRSNLPCLGHRAYSLFDRVVASNRSDLASGAIRGSAVALHCACRRRLWSGQSAVHGTVSFPESTVQKTHPKSATETVRRWRAGDRAVPDRANRRLSWPWRKGSR